MIFMSRNLLRIGFALLAAGTIQSASAFSLLGPPDAWQIPRIGYMLTPNDWNFDVGGPMNLGEEYRWNIKTITYGIDNSFKSYFGQRGVDEIRKAVAIINNLPPMSKLSSNLTEFPTDTKRVNYQAAALGVVDLKTYALAMLVNNLGLASPERYTWALRARIEFPGLVEYHVIQRNFDPVTLTPSRYVNGTLYTYSILEFSPTTAGDVADAVELPVDPLDFAYTSVANATDGQFGFIPSYGEFFTGLTRDDVGGLRYLYAGKGPYKNSNVESLMPDVVTNTLATGGSTWGPIVTGPPVNAALRPGIDKIVLREAKYDSEIGFFITVTNTYKDTYVTNNQARTQSIQRVLVQPDILFDAFSLDVSLLARTDTSLWVNNTALGQQAINAGPGNILPISFLSFNKDGPIWVNQTPNFLDEQNSFFVFVWGSFDGTTNAPFIYPNGGSLSELEDRVLNP
jgi:hypothetical protein